MGLRENYQASKAAGYSDEEIEAHIRPRLEAQIKEAGASHSLDDIKASLERQGLRKEFVSDLTTTPTEKVEKAVDAGIQRAAGPLREAAGAALKPLESLAPERDATLGVMGAAEKQLGEAAKVPIPVLAPIAKKLDAGAAGLQNAIEDKLTSKGVSPELAAIPAVAAGLPARLARGFVPANAAEAEILAAMAGLGAAGGAAAAESPLLSAPMSRMPNIIRQRLGLPVVGTEVPGAPAGAANVTPPRPVPPPAGLEPPPARAALPDLPARPQVGYEAPIQGEGFQAPQVLPPKDVSTRAAGDIRIPGAPAASLAPTGEGLSPAEAAIRRRLGLLNTPPEAVTSQPAAPTAPAPKVSSKSLAVMVRGGRDQALAPENIDVLTANFGKIPKTERAWFGSMVKSKFLSAIRNGDQETAAALEGRLKTLGIKVAPEEMPEPIEQRPAPGPTGRPQAPDQISRPPERQSLPEPPRPTEISSPGPLEASKPSQTESLPSSITTFRENVKTQPHEAFSPMMQATLESEAKTLGLDHRNMEHRQPILDAVHARNTEQLHPERGTPTGVLAMNKAPEGRAQAMLLESITRADARLKELDPTYVTDTKTSDALAKLKGEPTSDEKAAYEAQQARELEKETQHMMGGSSKPVHEVINAGGGLDRDAFEKAGLIDKAGRGEAENVPRNLWRRGSGLKPDELAANSYDRGHIPDQDVYMALEGVSHEAAEGKPRWATMGPLEGPGQEGFVRTGNAAPDQPQMVTDYQNRIRSFGENRPGLGQRLGKFLRDLHREVVNSEAPLEQLRGLYKGEIQKDEDLYNLLSRARGSAGIAKANLTVGTFRLNPDGSLTKTGEPLSAILKDMGASYRDIETYMVAKRTMDLAGREIEGLDPQRAPAVVAFMEQKYGPKIAEIAKRYVAWEDRAWLQPFLDLNIKTPEEVEAIRNSGQSYLAFRRWFDELEGSGTISGGNPLKRMKGSERDIMSPFEYAPKQNQSFVNFFEKVRIKQAIYKMKNLSPELAEQIKEVPKGHAGTISIPIGGETKFLEVSPEIKAVVDNFTPAAGRAILNLMSLPAKLQRAGITLDPRFSIFTHPFKYQVEASLFAKRGFIPVYDYLRGLSQVIGDGKYYQEWMAGGGDQTSVVAGDMADAPAKLEQLVGYKPASRDFSPLHLLQKVREWDDQGVRLGIYQRTREAGTPVADAIRETREGVVDPGRHGSATSTVSKLTPFWNIHLQSDAVLARALKDNPAKFFSRLAPWLAGTIALWYVNKDDPEYQEEPAWKKMALWLIPAGKDKQTGRTRFLRIPKPFAPGVLFLGGTEALLDHIYHQDPKALDNWLKQTMESLLPLPVPTVALLPFEEKADYDMFRDRPIVPANKQRLQVQDQYGDFTTETAKAVGRKLNLAPAKVDFAMHTLGGTLGGRGIRAIDEYIKPKDAPAAPQAAWSPFEPPAIGSESESVKRFYDYARELEAEYLSGRAKRPELAETPVSPALMNFREADDRIKMLNLEVKRIREDRKMVPETKKYTIDKIETAITSIASRAVKAYERRPRQK